MVNCFQPKFQLGQIVATPAALQVVEQGGQSPADFLDRHVRGDWGVISPDDQQLNEEALQDGSRIMSVYRTAKNTKIWIITEAADDQGQRSATTILLPEEY